MFPLVGAASLPLCGKRQMPAARFFFFLSCAQHFVQHFTNDSPPTAGFALGSVDDARCLLSVCNGLHSDLASRLGRSVLELLKMPAIQALVMSGMGSKNEATVKAAK